MKALCVLLLIATAFADETKCVDNGVQYSNGQTWTVQNAFTIKCLTESNGSWKTEIVGCVSPDGVSVKVGEKVDAGQKTYECLDNGNKQIVLKETRGQRADCGTRKYGDEWREKTFKFRCEAGGVTKFIACVGSDGTEILANTVGKVGDFDVRCDQHANGTISMQAANAPNSFDCALKDGTKVKNGEKYIDGEFVRKCGDYGKGKIVACKPSNSDQEIPLNQNVTIGTVTYSCVKDGDRFRFRTFSAKVIEPKCHYENETYENGTTWIIQDSFRVQCVVFGNFTFSMPVMACITPDKQEIGVGNSIETTDNVFECTSGNISLLIKPGKQSKCRGKYDVNEEFEENGMRLKCGEYGKTEVIACVYSDGTVIPISQSRRVQNGLAVECVRENDTIHLRAAKNATCEDGNKVTKQPNEEWKEGNFVRKCGQFGVATVEACWVQEFNQIVELNTNFTSNGKVFSCEKNGELHSFRVSAVPTVVTNATVV